MLSATSQRWNGSPVREVSIVKGSSKEAPDHVFGNEWGRAIFPLLQRQYRRMNEKQSDREYGPVGRCLYLTDIYSTPSTGSHLPYVRIVKSLIPEGVVLKHTRQRSQGTSRVVADSHTARSHDVSLNRRQRTNLEAATHWRWALAKSDLTF